MTLPVSDVTHSDTQSAPDANDGAVLAPAAPCDIVIVLDRSGSMAGCREDAVGAINGYLREVAATGVDGLVSVVLFDSEGIDEIRHQVPLSVCAPIRPEEFEPRALTPLFDAIGRGVALLGARQVPGRRAILVILTDGYEDASREHSAASIKALLEARKAAGWLVVYLGADHDAWGQASTLGVDAGLTAGFAKGCFGAVEHGLGRVSRDYVVGFAPDRCVFSDTDRAAMRGAAAGDEKSGLG